MTRKEWVAAVARQISRTMPDMYPSGYALFLAESYAAEGGYEKYAAGGYAPDKLWEPEA